MSDPVVLLSTGDVVGPAGGVTDNSMVLFSGTSGKLIKGNNAVVTAAGLALLDDVDAAAQRATLGLGNVNNTSDIDKPISTATQTALNLKATIASPTFTGTPTAPTAAAGTNTTQLANTAFVKAAVDAAPILGVGQTWQNLTASRVAGTTYTNTTGRPIMICVGTSGVGTSGIEVIVNGLPVIGNTTVSYSGTDRSSVSVVIPNTNTYSITADGTITWLELR